MSEYVRKAQTMALRLISEEFETAGSTDLAMRRVARRHNIPFGALWNLRYRAPKDVFASVYFAIHEAYEATRAAHERQLQHEIRLQEIAGRGNAPLVRAARRIGGQNHG